MLFLLYFQFLTSNSKEFGTFSVNICLTDSYLVYLVSKHNKIEIISPRRLPLGIFNMATTAILKKKTLFVSRWILEIESFFYKKGKFEVTSSINRYRIDIIKRPAENIIFTLFAVLDLKFMSIRYFFKKYLFFRLLFSIFDIKTLKN